MMKAPLQLIDIPEFEIIQCQKSNGKLAINNKEIIAYSIACQCQKSNVKISINNKEIIAYSIAFPGNEL